MPLHRNILDILYRRSPIISPAAPINYFAPVISGTMQVASVLTTTDGLWTASPAAVYTYQWQRAGVDIALATNATYTQVEADTGYSITCIVTATNASGAASATSNALVWVPTSYTGNIFDYDGLVGVTKDGSDRISIVSDLSGNSRHLLQATGAKQPLWLAGGIIRTVTSRFLQAIFATPGVPIYVFGVMQVTAGTFNVSDSVLDGGIQTRALLVEMTAGPSTYMYQGAGLTAPANYMIGGSGFEQFGLLFNGPQSAMYASRVGLIGGSDGGTADTAGFTLGARGGTGTLGVPLAEFKRVFAYNRTFVAAQLLTIQSYLTNFYGVV